jgi:hypothetical protein
MKKCTEKLNAIAYMQFAAKINSFPIWASNGAEITKK